MGIQQFDNLGDKLLVDDVDIQEEDSLYKPKELEDIAHRLTFVLFDEIIEDSPTQSRREVFNPANNKEDKELLESIQVHGIISPIAVRAIRGKNNIQGRREFALVSGHRRVAAGKAANLPGVEGVVTKTDDDHEVLTLVENMGRKELSSFEKAAALNSLKEQRDLSIRQVAAITGLSKSYLSEIFQALKSPEVLKIVWAEKEISPKAIVLLKEHWDLFEQEEAAPLHKQMRGLSQQKASNLSAQLRAGTSLKKALVMVNSNGQISRSLKSSGRNSTDKAEPDPGPTIIKKDELLAAISAVFPRIKERQVRILYDFAVVYGVKDLEVLWGAALYVDRGGNINRAIKVTSKVMSKRSTKSRVNSEVALMKKVARDLKTMTKEDKTIKDYLQVVFSSRG